MAFNIGVNVVEVNGTGAPSITGAAVSVGAFAVLTQRGIPHQPARVTSYPQFVERFGGYFTGGLGAYLVKGFFDNGGQTAYISRVVDTTAETGASPAVRTLTDGASAPKDVLGVEAGFRGQADPGSWGNRTFIKVRHSSSASSALAETAPAVVAGTALPATIDLTDPPDLKIQVDESLTVTLSFPASRFADRAAATPAEVAAAINGQANQVHATVVSSKLTLTSTGEHARIAGTSTALQVTAPCAPLGFAAAMTAPTFGTPADLNTGGTTLRSARDFTVGDEVVISDDSRTRSAVLTGVDTVSGAVTWSPPLTAPNDFTDRRQIRVNAAEFDLLVATGVGDDEHVVESHTGLSMQTGLGNYAVRVLNHTLTGSRFVRLTDLPSDTQARPEESDSWLALQDGTDGTPTSKDFIGDEAARTGLPAFNPFDVQLLCCESTDTSVAIAARDYCAKRGDALFIGAVPEGFVAAGQAVAYGNVLQVANGYGALYGPWIIIPDPIGPGPDPRITIPPTGHVMGVYARIESTRGIWKAPAGDEANLLGVLDVETRLSDADHTDLVTNGSVNGIRAVPRAGIVIDASRTLSTDPRWRYVNVRLLFNYVKSSLRDGLRWVRQEPNRDTLWAAVQYGTVTPFLTGLWRQGAFGTGTAEQTFTVVVDATNNPPEQVEQGRLTVEVYFYPSRPAETIVIMVGQQPSGATTSEPSS
jgi:phage tail sheath protein FI